MAEAYFRVVTAIIGKYKFMLTRYRLYLMEMQNFQVLVFWPTYEQALF